MTINCLLLTTILYSLFPISDYSLFGCSALINFINRTQQTEAAYITLANLTYLRTIRYILSKLPGKHKNATEKFDFAQIMEAKFIDCHSFLQHSEVSFSHAIRVNLASKN